MNPFYGFDAAGQPLPESSTGHGVPNFSDETGAAVGREDSESELSEPKKARPRKWDSQTRLRLVDGGMSNNLPNHILARPDRRADIIVAFDASSDIQSRHAEQRLHNCAEDSHMSLEDVTGSFHDPTPNYVATDAVSSAAAETEAKHLHRYVKVYRGTRENGTEKLYIVYCPLLSDGANPELVPSVSCFGWPDDPSCFLDPYILTSTVVRPSFFSRLSNQTKIWGKKKEKKRPRAILHLVQFGMGTGAGEDAIRDGQGRSLAVRHTRHRACHQTRL